MRASRRLSRGALCLTEAFRSATEAFCEPRTIGSAKLSRRRESNGQRAGNRQSGFGSFKTEGNERSAKTRVLCFIRPLYLSPLYFPTVITQDNPVLDNPNRRNQKSKLESRDQRLARDPQAGPPKPPTNAKDDGLWSMFSVILCSYESTGASAGTGRSGRRHGGHLAALPVSPGRPNREPRHPQLRHLRGRDAARPPHRAHFARPEAAGDVRVVF